MGLEWGRTFRRTAVVVCAGAVLSGAIAGCTENLNGTGGCPITCVDVSSQIVTDTISAVPIDTTVLAGLGLGSETRMLLSSRGDTLDTRVIVRFDSLPPRTVRSASDTTSVPITFIDSAYLHLQFDSLGAANPVAVTVSVYDVETSSTNDTAVAVLAPLFVPERLLATRTYAVGALIDTTSIQLPSDSVLQRVQGGRSLRLGLRISGGNRSVSARLLSSETLNGPRLKMRVSADTAIPAITVTPRSKTPADNRVVSTSLSDFTLIVKGTPIPDSNTLAVGGLPATRSYFRFSVPSHILDSALVVRATLVLTQISSSAPDGGDTMLVQPRIVVAGAVVTDPARAAQIISTSLVGLEPLQTFPQAGGLREIEIAPIVRVWALQQEADFPRALVLQSSQEALSPQQALFHSSEDPDPSVRPKLIISYTLRARIGIP